MPLPRRTLLRAAGGIALTPVAAPIASAQRVPRVRPGDPGWPDPAAWKTLNDSVGGRLIKVQPLLAACGTTPANPTCTEALRELTNPYWLGEQAAGTQTSGWIDSWRSAPSAYAVSPHSARDVAAAVNFARTHRLRLVIKGGGHSYIGGSNAADSLLVWMRPMDRVTLHDAFVGQGCAGSQPPAQAVSVETGARWLPVYNAVTTAAGRYVQGGGCTTVGVAGLVLGNGFGSFSKQYGSAAASLLEAEIVTADGAIRIANACTNSDLFWALKGAGYGSFGVVTRLTLRTHAIPEFCGLAFGRIKASSDEAFRRLIARFTQLYATAMFNPHWGESVSFGGDNVLGLALVFHDATEAEARNTLKPLLEFAAAAPGDYAIAQPIMIVAIPARHWWDPDYLSRAVPSIVVHDDRPGSSSADVWYAGDAGQAGWFIHGYESAWLPAALLGETERGRLDDALFAASRHWRVALHFNKGLAGGNPEAIAETRQTAMNPAVADAFALAVIGHGGPPAFPGMPGDGPDLTLARRDAAAIGRAIRTLRELAPDAGSYVSEAAYADRDWPRRSFGPNYDRLLAVKRRYDPEGLFTTHHGVGSEEWSADGFTPA